MGILGDAVQQARQFQGLALEQNQLKQQQQLAERQRLGMEALNRYRETAQAGAPDENAMTVALINNPEAASAVLSHVGIQDKRQKQDAASFALRAATIADNPQQFMQAIDSRIAYLQQAGRNPKDTIALREQYAAGDIAGAKQALKSISAALVGDGSLDKSAYEMTFGKAPESMNEYQKANIEIDKQRLALQQSQLAQTGGMSVDQWKWKTYQELLNTDPAKAKAFGRANGFEPVSVDAAAQGAVAEAKTSGKINAERVGETKKAIKMNDQVLQYAKTAEELLPKATGSGVGSVVDAAGRVVGVSSKSAEAAAKLKTLSGWLVSNVPRMEGPQSNVDVQNYQKMAGDIGNDRLTIEERMASLNALKQLIQSQKDLNSQVLSGKMQSVYDPNYVPTQAPAAPATSRFKIEVVQ